MEFNAMEISKKSMLEPSDWEYKFLLHEKLRYEEVTGDDFVKFIVDKEKQELLGFTIKIIKKNGFDSYWEANEKAKKITNLLSVIYGDYVSAYSKSFTVNTSIGQTSATIMDVSNPLKPLQKIKLNLKDQNIINLIEDKEISEKIHYLTNALYDSYRNPESAIRELVLFHGDYKKLPSQFKKFETLRHALSHIKLRTELKNILIDNFKLLELNNKNMDKISAKNLSILIMENFHFLHNSVDQFRKEYCLETKKLEK